MNVTIDGVRLHAISAGNGSCVVLLHGFPLSDVIWNAQLEALSSASHVIAPDLRGMGQSDAPPGPYLMEHLAADIAAMLDILGVSRAAIVGHSMGGYAALSFFRMFSERVSSLTLMCSRVDADTPQAAERRIALATRLEREGMEPAVDEYLPKLLAADASSGLVGSVAAVMRSQNPMGAAALLRGAAVRASSDDLLEDLDVPVLIVCGSDDAISPPETNAGVAARIHDSELKVIERSAHLPMLENPHATERRSQGLPAALGNHSGVKRMVVVGTIVASAFLLSAAATQAQSKPLRHLVYNVGVTESTQTDELVMGNHDWMPTAGSGVAHYSGGMLSNGTIDVDIIGFTNEGDALAVQISEHTDNRRSPVVRVDVTSDGALRMRSEDAINLTSEEQALLRLLARKFLSQDGMLAGTWVHQLIDRQADIHEEFHVTGTQPNGDINIALDERIKVSGAQPFDTTTHGTITYSPAYKVPRLVLIDGRTHHEGLQQTQTEDLKVHLNLVSDSFEPNS